MARRSDRRSTGWTVGILGTVAVTLTFFVLPESLPKAVPALVLLVPVCVASAMAGWKVGVATALLGALAYSIAFVPPIGRLPVQWTEDLYVLAAFVVVAVVVGVSVGQRRDEEVDALDDQRAMLLRSVSHDLRSPLSTIQTVSTDLAEGPGYDETTQRELIAIVANEATRLNRIVGNLLSVSRVHAGTFEPALEPLDVRELLVVAASRLAADDRPTIAVEVDDRTPDVLADPIQIDQVVTNLLDNALRHAPADSVVRVGASSDGDVVQLAVVDDGPGFSPRAIATLVSGATSPPVGGTGGSGLGLTICRAIVVAHGGSIWVDESAPGGTVRFTLPIAA